MPAPRKTVLAILFNARIAENASAGTGATLIQTLIAQQFTTVLKNLGRITVSVGSGGKTYSFTAMKVEDIVGDAMEAWQMWGKLSTTQLAALLDNLPIRRTVATFTNWPTQNFQTS